jgi:hypothetical protein
MKLARRGRSAAGPGALASDEATLHWCLAVVAQVNEQEAAARTCTDSELGQRTGGG